MISKRRAALLGAVAIVVAAATLFTWWRRERSTTACCPGAGPAALNDSIAVDSNVRSGALPNGVRYYVLANRSSDARDQLRLVVNAGSVLEDDDQRGLAHAVEHMVLRDTRHFRAGAIEHYFERIGMRRGEGVNASTSLDETVYRMAVPSNRPGAVDTALAMLASIAHEATFDGIHDSTEAGILIEEWRSHRDADLRRHTVCRAASDRRHDRAPTVRYPCDAPLL